MTGGPEYLVPPVRGHGPIHLAEPDPLWAERYREHEVRIRRALGDGIALLEHVGSTSVPGLTAKPIIDIVLVVPDSADEPSYVPALEAAGYRLHLREPDWHEHRLLRDEDGFPTNLHVLSPGSPEVGRMLTFRDLLRSHPEDRDRYAAVKRSLATQHWDRVQDYADAKTTIVEDIVGRAPNKP